MFGEDVTKSLLVLFLICISELISKDGPGQPCARFMLWKVIYLSRLRGLAWLFAVLRGPENSVKLPRTIRPVRKAVGGGGEGGLLAFKKRDG